MKRGEHTPESKRRREQLQRKKRRYMELRDELQLAGVLPVEPAGAIKDKDRVDPATQGSQALPALIPEAIRKGWAVPEEKKPALVDEMVKIVDDPEEKNKVKVAAFNALRMADQTQYERDHPEEVGKTKGGGVKVAVVNSVGVGNVFDDIARDARLIEGEVVAGAGGDIQADGDAEPLDEAQPDHAEAQRAATRIPDGDAPRP